MVRDMREDRGLLQEEQDYLSATFVTLIITINQMQNYQNRPIRAGTNEFLNLLLKNNEVI